ncbi:MAG: hypothetical protein AB7P03_16370 [Kofleriaceae bacterium]
MANANDDDDILSGPVPAPDEEASPGERSHAKTFGDIIDKALIGRAPAAMSTDDRALLEVATVIRAASGNVELTLAKQHSIVEAALRQAVGMGTAAGAVAPIERARSRRWLPWTIAGVSTAVAAAAVLVLVLRSPQAIRPDAPVSESAQLPTEWLSRPADPLIGPIARERAGDAVSRIDYLFADRLDGFRERRLAGGGGTR